MLPAPAAIAVDHHAPSRGHGCTLPDCNRASSLDRAGCGDLFRRVRARLGRAPRRTRAALGVASGARRSHCRRRRRRRPAPRSPPARASRRRSRRRPAAAVAAFTRATSSDELGGQLGALAGDAGARDAVDEPARHRADLGETLGRRRRGRQEHGVDALRRREPRARHVGRQVGHDHAADARLAHRARRPWAAPCASSGFRYVMSATGGASVAAGRR